MSALVAVWLIAAAMFGTWIATGWLAGRARDARASWRSERSRQSFYLGVWR